MYFDLYENLAQLLFTVDDDKIRSSFKKSKSHSGLFTLFCVLREGIDDFISLK